MAFTDVFNVVLNAPGVRGFVGAMNSANSAVSSVTNTVARIGKEAQISGRSAEYLSAVHEKLGARAQATASRLEIFRDRVAASNAVLERQREVVADVSARLQENERLQAQAMARMQALAASGQKNSEAYANQATYLERLKLGHAAIVAEQQKEIASLDALTKRNQVLNDTLKVREASLKILQARTRETTQLSGWQKMAADVVRGFLAFEKITYTAQRVQNAFERLRTAAEFFGIIKRKAEEAHHPIKQTGLGIFDIGRFAGQAGQPLGFLGTSLAVATGTAIINGLTAIGSTLMNIGQQAVQVVKDFESFNFSMRAMIAQQKVMTGAAENFEEGLKASGKEAAAYVRWMERFAILSPFQEADIRQIFNVAQGMGMTAEQAKLVTERTTNWAAANAKGGAEMYRVVYAVSQMNAAAKLNAQDIGQLAQVGLGWAKIQQQLAKDLGKTTDEIQRMRDAGQITGQMAAQAVLNYMDTFGEAAKAQSETWQGLLSTLSEVTPKFLREIFGPFDVETGRVMGLLGELQERLSKVVGFLTSDVAMTLARNFGMSLSGLADNALTWGENIVTQLAQGMYNGLVSVLEALTEIGSLIAYWLSPGSPPRILPDIDRWGAETMAEWMRGWTQADFSGFSDISRTVEGFLRAVAPDTKESKADVARAILGSRAGIVEALGQLKDMGQVADETINRIATQYGAGEASLTNYLRTFFKLQGANKAVESAQAAVNAITEKYDRLLKDVDAKLQRIDVAQSRFVNKNKKSQLALILADPNATRQEKEMARLEMERLDLLDKRAEIAAGMEDELKPAQEKLEAALKEQQALEAQLAIQQQMLALQQEQARYLKDYMEALKGEGGAAGAKGGAGGAKPKGAGIAGGGLSFDTPEVKLPGIIQDLQARLQLLQEAWGRAWEAILAKLAPVTIGFENFRLGVSNLFTSLGVHAETARRIVADMVVFLTEQFSIYLPTLFTNLGTLLTEMGKWWEVWGDDIMYVVNFAFRIVVTTILSALTLVSGWLAAIMAAINGDWAKGWDIMRSTVGTILNGILNIVGINLDEFIASWVRALTLWGQLVIIVLTKVKDSFLEGMDRIKELVDGGLSKVAGFFENLKDRIAEALGALVTIIGTAVGDWWEAFSNAVKNNDFVQIGAQVIDGIIEGIKNAAGALATAAARAVGDALRAAKEAIIAKSPSKKTERELGIPFIEGMTVGISKTAPQLYRAVEAVMRRSMLSGEIAIAPAASGRQQALSGYTENSTVNNFNYAPTYQSAPRSPTLDFAAMQVWAGA